MKRLVLFFCLMMFCSLAEAKYNPPPEGRVKTKATKTAEYMFNYMDTSGDGKLSLEEYEGMQRTRDVRRKEREAKKEGTYKTLEEEFLLMKPDKGGFVTLEQMEDFKNGREVREPADALDEAAEAEVETEPKIAPVKEEDLRYQNP